LTGASVVLADISRDFTQSLQVNAAIARLVASDTSTSFSVYSVFKNNGAVSKVNKK
jgi:peroxiredoxin